MAPERLLAFEPAEFMAIMMRWFDAYVPKAGYTIPGVADDLFKNITVPTMIIRGGKDDLDHPRRTSIEVNCLIADSELVEPPWAEDAWETSVAAMRNGTGHMFDPWPLAAPLIRDFVRRA